MRYKRLLRTITPIILLFALLISGQHGAGSAPLGYFPPSRYSNSRGSSSFWSDNTKPAQTLSEKQSQLIKATLKELSKAGISRGKQSGCIKTISEAISSSGKNYDKAASRDEATQLENAATCCAQSGREDLAEDISHCSLKIFGSSGNTASVGAVNTLDNLAGLSFRKGSCDKAIGFLNQALEIQRTYTFTGPSDTGLLLTHLAQCYARAGKYDESEKIMSRAIITDREKMGETSLAVAEDYYNLGVTHYLKGDRAKAEQCVKTALEMLPKISQKPTEQKNAWSKFYSRIQKESEEK